MQVRKFEAGSIQEALKLVKMEMGPDAIILSAKDNSSGFGLLSQDSVEVTAAAPERGLEKKRFLESRLGESDQIRFKQAPARVQKQLIERTVSKYLAESQNTGLRSRPRYATIMDEVVEEPQESPELSPASKAAPQNAQSRIRNAVQAAWQAGKEVVPAKQAPKVAATGAVFAEPGKDTEIASLKQEISRLREMLADISQGAKMASTSHPLAAYGLPYEMVPVHDKFKNVGLDQDIIIEVLKMAYGALGPERGRKSSLVEAFAAQWFLENTKVSKDPFAGRVHLFAGPSGSGKTSTLVKFASHLVLKEKKTVAVLSADTSKVGAADQLRIFCKILNVPFAILRNKSDWPYLLEQLRPFDHILVDGEGATLKQLEEIDAARTLLPPEGVDFSTHLTLPATLRDKEGYEFARRFKILKVKDLIITHLDQSTQHGLIFNLQKVTQLPLNSFGLGPQIPEDFEVATKERVLDLLYKLSQRRAGRTANE